MNAPRYTLPAMLLHWAQAAIVLWLLWRGWTMLDLPKGPLRSAAYGLHKSWGLVALGLVLLRLVWRWRNPPPPALAGGFEAVVARIVHRGLYLMLLLAPLAGYLASSFTPYAVKLFGVELPRLGWPDEALNGAFKAVHVFAVWAIAGLVGLHVAGALKHAIQRDGTLSRMLPRWLFRN